MIKNIYDMTDTEINDMIQKYLPIKITEKNKFGEVFTNPELINQMLDLFPKNVWHNPNAKWLEPSCGICNFTILVYQRLMKGLEKWQTNKKKRSDHIIQHMLFMVELNPTNCKICRQIFGPKSNILCDDFLENHGFSSMSFDFIVGNPPFQDDYSSSNSKSIGRINGGKSKLYERIFLKSLSMLKSGGLLSFITPDNLFSGNGVTGYNSICQNDVQFVSFNTKIQSYFPGIQQSMCFFLLCKEKPSRTLVENSIGDKFYTILKNRPVNPVRDWTPITEKLVRTYVSNERNNVKYNRGKPVSSYKGNKYSIIYTPSKTLHTNKLELAIGLNIKKVVIFAISPELEFFMDYSGKYGIGPNTFYVPFNSLAQGKQFEKFFKSDDYKRLALATKTTRQYLKIGFIEHLNLSKILHENHAKTRIKRKYNIANKTRKNRK
jgi:hypothetical protein